MNTEIANELCPIYKAEIKEYVVIVPEGILQKKNIIKVKLSVFKKENIDDSWCLIYEEDINEMLVACAHLVTIYNRLKNNQEIIFLNSQDFKVGNPFPLQKIIIEEFLYGKDNGNSWDDPENDIRKKIKVEYYFQKGINSDWDLNYNEFGNSFEYKTLEAATNYIKLIEHIPFEFYSLYWKPENDDNIAMFEAEGHMFKFTYHIYKQKAICGTAITDYINEYENDNSIKVDYLRSYVRIFKKNEMVSFMRKLFMNGNFLVSYNDLEEKYGISEMDIDFCNDNFLSWIKSNYPETKTLSTLMAWINIGED